MLTTRELEILQHALGVDQYGRGQMHRNHYCAGGDDVADCAGLVALGLMRSFRSEHWPYFNCTVTDEGRSVMFRESPKPPKKTRSQLRYLRFLNWGCGTFGEFLKWEKDGCPNLI